MAIVPCVDFVNYIYLSYVIKLDLNKGTFKNAPNARVEHRAEGLLTNHWRNKIHICEKQFTENIVVTVMILRHKYA